jgi:hypothetical protein
VCTNHELGPWVMVDLQKSQPIATVKVYNRGDCCWGNWDLPAVLELSDDGVHFSQVARRTTGYSSTDPWVVPVSGQAGRFVRLRVDAPEPRELVLNEIEVFTR